MIGAKLKKYRQGLKVTGETLSNLAGIKRSWLSQIENEKKYPPVDTFMNLIEAISKISVLNDENSKEVLTEDLYQDFMALLDIHYFHNSPNDKDYNENLIIENNVRVNCYHPESKYGSISIEFVVNKSNIDEVTSDDIEEYVRPIFFDEYKDDWMNPSNLYDEHDERAMVYELSDVRQSLYEWWYNHILKDFYETFNTSIQITNEEMVIFGSLLSLRNPDGSFTPYNSDEITNIPKELLKGKMVTFDISSIKDKNLRLTLDGKPLTNSEMEMLNVSLSAIKYNRQQK